MNSLEIIRPDDWHCHLRDGSFLNRTVTDSARVFGRTVVMPNLSVPIFTVKDAMDYRERIFAQNPESHFTPMMTLYLHENMSLETIIAAAQHQAIIGAKLYPANVTTQSSQGIRKIETIYPLLEQMEKFGLPLLVHGESNDPLIDVFDREAHFIDHHLLPIIQQFPTLRIVLEHISTGYAAQFVKQQGPQIAATITVHHLLYNRNQMLGQGLKPHLYCMPLLKARKDQEQLIEAAIGGDPHFFLGTDSAPHPIGNKLSSCGCAGIYASVNAIECLTQLFDGLNQLKQLESFTSIHGACFYDMPINTDTVVLTREPWIVPNSLTLGNSQVVPMEAGKTVTWKLKKESCEEHN